MWPFNLFKKKQSVDEKEAIKTVITSIPTIERSAAKLIGRHSIQTTKLFSEIQRLDADFDKLSKDPSQEKLKSMKEQLRALEAKQAKAARLLEELEQTKSDLERDISVTSSFLRGFKNYLQRQRQRIQSLKVQAEEPYEQMPQQRAA